MNQFPEEVTCLRKCCGLRLWMTGTCMFGCGFITSGPRSLWHCRITHGLLVLRHFALARKRVPDVGSPIAM